MAVLAGLPEHQGPLLSMGLLILPRAPLVLKRSAVLTIKLKLFNTKLLKKRRHSSEVWRRRGNNTSAEHWRRRRAKGSGEVKKKNRKCEVAGTA